MVRAKLIGHQAEAISNVPRLAATEYAVSEFSGLSVE